MEDAVAAVEAEVARKREHVEATASQYAASRALMGGAEVACSSDGRVICLFGKWVQERDVSALYCAFLLVL